MLNARGCVHLLGHYDRLPIELEGHGCIRARGFRTRLHIARSRLKRRARLHYRVDVLWRCAAAAANNMHSVFLDESLVIVGQLLRCELINGPTAFVVGQAGIWQNRNGLRAVMAQVAHRIVHFPRAGRTVQADNIDVVDIQNCGRGIDIRA